MNFLALVLAPRLAQRYGDTRAQAWRAALPALVVNNPVLALALTTAMARRFGQSDVAAKAADVAAKAADPAPATIPPATQFTQEVQALLAQAGVPPLLNRFVPSFLGLNFQQVQQMTAIAQLSVDVSGNTDGLVQMQCPLPGSDWDDGLTSVQLRFI